MRDAPTPPDDGPPPAPEPVEVGIQLNGQPRRVSRGTPLRELVASLGLPAQGALVEHNGVALHRREWEERTLAEGDRVEVLRVVAGG